MQRIERDAAELKRRAFDDADVDARQAVDGGRGDLASDALLEVQRRGDVIGMDVRVERVGQREPERLQDVKMAVDRIDDRVDQHRLPGLLTPEQVGVGAGNGFEQLVEDQGVLLAGNVIP